MYKHILTIMLLFSSFFINSVESKDFGIRGELFLIQEENLAALIQQQLSSQFSKEELNSLLEESKKTGKRPKFHITLPEAQQDTTFYHDPTYTASESITDLNGRMIVSKGSRVNPLKNMQLDSGLLFFDGDNPTHIRWAKQQQGLFKWILVKGNPFALEEQEKRPVYFDQNGFSIDKFQLKQIPARITQEGLFLKIEEIALKKGNSP